MLVKLTIIEHCYKEKYTFIKLNQIAKWEIHNFY
jgi:hypothetical protein